MIEQQIVAPSEIIATRVQCGSTVEPAAGRENIERLRESSCVYQLLGLRIIAANNSGYVLHLDVPSSFENLFATMV